MATKESVCEAEMKIIDLMFMKDIPYLDYNLRYYRYLCDQQCYRTKDQFIKDKREKADLIIYLEIRYTYQDYEITINHPMFIYSLESGTSHRIRFDEITTDSGFMSMTTSVVCKTFIYQDNDKYVKSIKKIRVTKNIIDTTLFSDKHLLLALELINTTEHSNNKIKLIEDIFPPKKFYDSRWIEMSIVTE